MKKLRSIFANAMVIAVLSTISLLVVVGHAQKPPTPAAPQAEPSKVPATPAQFKPTDAQRYRMQAAQQEFFRWQDKVNEAAQRFGEACQAAQQENKWPEVVCHMDSCLGGSDPNCRPGVPAVTLREGQEQPAAPVPVVVPATPPAPPPAAKEKSPK